MLDEFLGESPCVEGTTARTQAGYNHTSVPVGPGKRYDMLAHRISFEKTWGIKLKPDQVVRHSCDNPGCINPLHLQLGNQSDNIKDAVRRGRHTGNGNQYKTHCPRGHEYSESNTYVYRSGSRGCRTCNRER